jgi:hypothetical protein
VSLSTYDLAWESQGRPQVVYISFIKYVSPAPDAAAGSGRRLRTPPDAGSGRRFRTPPDAGSGRRFRTPPVRRRAGVTRPRPERFRIDDRYIFAAHQLFVFRSVAENPTSSATRKRTKRFRHRVRDHDDTRGEQKT